MNNYCIVELKNIKASIKNLKLLKHKKNKSWKIYIGVYNGELYLSKEVLSYPPRHEIIVEKIKLTEEHCSAFTCSISESDLEVISSIKGTKGALVIAYDNPQYITFIKDGESVNIEILKQEENKFIDMDNKLLKDNIKELIFSSDFILKGIEYCSPVSNEVNEEIRPMWSRIAIFPDLGLVSTDGTQLHIYGKSPLDNEYNPSNFNNLLFIPKTIIKYLTSMLNNENQIKFSYNLDSAFIKISTSLQSLYYPREEAGETYPNINYVIKQISDKDIKLVFNGKEWGSILESIEDKILLRTKLSYKTIKLHIDPNDKDTITLSYINKEENVEKVKLTCSVSGNPPTEFITAFQLRFLKDSINNEEYCMYLKMGSKYPDPVTITSSQYYSIFMPCRLD